MPQKCPERCVGALIHLQAKRWGKKFQERNKGRAAGLYLVSQVVVSKVIFKMRMDMQGSAGSPLSVTSAASRCKSATPEVTSGGMVFETTRYRPTNPLRSIPYTDNCVFLSQEWMSHTCLLSNKAL